MLKLMSDLISGKVVPEQLFPDPIFLLLPRLSPKLAVANRKIVGNSKPQS